MNQNKRYTRSDNKSRQNTSPKDKKQQKWKPNTRTYKPKNEQTNPNKYTHNTNPNHSYNANTDHYNHYQHSNITYRPRYQTKNSYNRKPQPRPHSYNPNHKYSNSRQQIMRAPITECTAQFMSEVAQQNRHNKSGIQTYRYRHWSSTGWQESESLTVGRYFYSKTGTQIWKKPKQISNDQNYSECYKDYPWVNQVHFYNSNNTKIDKDIDSFLVSTNTFPIQLNPAINVLEYEINITPKEANKSESKTNISAWKMKKDLEKLFNRFEKKKIVRNAFDPYKIDDSAKVLFTFALKSDIISKNKKLIHFPQDFDDSHTYSFVLKSVHSLHFYAGLEQETELKTDENVSDSTDDEEVSPERRTQIFQCILSSILLKTGFKFIRFGPSKGWYPANKNESLNNVAPVYHNPKSMHLSKIGVIRGFRASITNSPTGVALKVSNTNKILHCQTLAAEMEELYHSDPDRYERNVYRFVGRKALYLPTQMVIDITEIHIKQSEQSTFTTKRSGRDVEISHKDNLLQKRVVNHVKSEKYGLVGNRHNFSFCPQFMHLLFDQDLSKKQCKDALEFLGKNVDYELKSVNNFVAHVIHAQNEEKSDMVLSLVSIANNAYETRAHMLPNMEISFKLNEQKFKRCNEQTIGYDWKSIGAVIHKPSNGPAQTLLVGASVSMVKKVKLHMINYLQRRRFGHSIIEKITDFIPKDILVTDGLKQLLSENKYGLVVLVLPNISDGSVLKRKVHRMCMELGIISQCISDEHFYEHNGHNKQRNVVWGMMSDIVYKLGATTYKLGAINNKSLDIKRTLVLGLDICHPTRIRSIERPSIAVMTSVYGNIMTPNIKQQKSAMFLNANRQEICGYHSMTAMSVNVLSRQLLREDIQSLPLCLWFCRDGVSDSQIPEMVSKELTALLLAIRKVKKLEGIKRKYGASVVKGWKPKIEWIVVQKRILDRFVVSKQDRNRVNINHYWPVFIVSNDVISGKYFEFYLQIGRRRIPKRVIFIRDDLDLRKNNEIIDVARFMYAMHWLYPPCIPFQMGPLNVPLTIKLSDHYASMWQDCIGYTDHGINDIKINPKLHNPQLVTID